MLSGSGLEQFPVRVILAVLLILEVACIAYTYSVRFDDYISFVTIVLSLLIAYFGTHYFLNKYRTVKTYEAVAEATQPDNAEDETRREVNKLIETPQFKKFQREKFLRAMRKGSEGTEEVGKEGKEMEETEGVIQELLELQEKIFDL